VTNTHADKWLREKNNKLMINIYFARGSIVMQSCTRVQISRSDPTRPTKIVTRPDLTDPLIFPASWTRPDPTTIHDGQKGFIIARCTLSSAYIQVTSSTKSASTLGTYQMSCFFSTNASRFARSCRSISVASRDIAL